MPENQRNSFWERDTLQFPRLIAEIAATIKLSDEQVTGLCQSMDISSSELSELFERATTKWEELKRIPEITADETTGKERHEGLPWEMRIPVLSTSHIKATTLNTLGGVHPERIAEYPEGAFVHIGRSTDDELLTEIPELAPIAKWFRDNYPNEVWLRIDCDGDQIEDAPTFSW